MDVCDCYYLWVFVGFTQIMNMVVNNVFRQCMLYCTSTLVRSGFHACEELVMTPLFVMYMLSTQSWLGEFFF